MKAIIKFGLIVSLLITTSCASTKNIGHTTERDGTSFAKAIIVKSIAEEYEYVRKACSDCQLLGQSLIFEKKKPYDILNLKKSNGETISYYFDISKFYGKGF